MSEFGVWIVVSAGVKTLATLWTSFHGPLYSGLCGVDEVGVLDPVAVHHREAVDVGLLGDRPGLVGGQRTARGRWDDAADVVGLARAAGRYRSRSGPAGQQCDDDHDRIAHEATT